MLDFSLLRIIGLALGLLLLAVSFLYFRGPRWNRSIFGLLSLFAAVLIVPAIDPAFVTGLSDALSLTGAPYGRLLALILVVLFGVILLAIYTKGKADRLAQLLDRTICGLAAENALSAANVSDLIKPIMILIPALNEEKNFEFLLPRIPRRIDGTEIGILVIDDGSTDGTGEVARKHGCMVARNVVRRGQGAALRVGHAILGRCGIQYAIAMDADNQHDPADIPKLLGPLLRNEADLVVGSRRAGSSSSTDFARSTGIVVLSRLISILSGQNISDCACGFQAFRPDRFTKLDLREDQFQNSELIMEAAKKGLRIQEVPVHITERAHGESHKGPNWHYGIFFAKAMVKTWWR